jgi:hypothetical protein
MSTIYSGNPGNVSNSLTRTITGAANNGSGLIRITTSTTHLFSPHDVVIITGVTGTTEANGTWSITVISSTTFDLVGSTFTNAYSSGGTAVDRSLTPAATLPSDGEQVTATSIIAAVQVCLDRTQFLATQPVEPTVLLLPPVPFNISYGSDWSVGDDGTGNSTGPRIVKTVPNDSALLFDLTQYVNQFNGRRLAQIETILAVGQSHSAVPVTLPAMLLFRTQSLTALGAITADQSLFSGVQRAFPTPGSGALWYASGHLQSWSLVTDQNNVIDTSRRYYLAIIDESGSNSLALNSYFGFRLTVN